MRTTLAITAITAMALLAQQPPQVRPTSQNPSTVPLIERDLFFGEVEIGGAQLSPDGKFMTFLRPYKGVRNIWVKKAGEPFSAARAITAETKRPVNIYFWTRDSKYVLYAQDKGGDENFNIYAVDPAATGEPAARDLTGLTGVTVAIYAVPKSTPDVIYIGLNDRDKAWHDLYRLKLSTGEKTLLRKNTDRIGGWVFDNKDELRLAVRTAENGDTEILRVDTDKLAKIYSCSVLEQCTPVRFDVKNQRAYLITNKGEKNLMELALLDPATGTATTVEMDPQKRVDFGNAMFSEVTNELVATSYEDDKTRLVWKNKGMEAEYRWLQGKLPGLEIARVSTTADEMQWIVRAFSDREPGAIYLFDRRKKSLEPLYKVREKLPREHLAERKPVRYESSDGLEIPGYLTLPKGVAAKNLPVVIVPHGGPWARDSWGYDPIAQFLANRGYAVLQPNFRASTGYGKEFLDKGNAEWGRKMQDDLTWGVKWLVAKGIADPKRVAIMGGSYGGYATLAGVAFTPDVYAAGVSIVGPSNLMTLLDSIPPYWEAFRKTLYARMADPGTPEGKKRLEAMSPLFSASKIKAPLLVMQGANDPRVNQAESDQIVMALRDRGFPVEYIVAPDEGHGFARPVNMLASMAAAERFLARHVGGRAEEGGSAEVVARLKEITVDPKSVKLAKKVDVSAVAGPKPSARPKPGKDVYSAKIEAGQQSIALKIISEVKEEGGQFVVLDAMESPQMQATDTSWLNAETLVVEKRSVRQGPAEIELAFAGGKVSGSMKMGGNERPVAVDLGGPTYMDAAGTMQSLAALPLTEGYQVVYRNFDLQKQKVKLMQLKVTGGEQVTVPAGTFEAWKVEATPTEGGAERTVYWVAKEPRKTVKVEAVLPAMGGAKLTAELQ